MGVFFANSMRRKHALEVRHPRRSVMATGGADGNVRVWVPPGESERYARA